MEFELTEEHRMIQAAARDFALTECLPGVLSNFFTEGFSFPGILERQFISAAGDTQRLAGNAYPAASQRFHGESKTESTLAYHVFFRHFHIVEYNTVGIAAANTEFIFFSTHYYAGPVLLHD